MTGPARSRYPDVMTFRNAVRLCDRHASIYSTLVGRVLADDDLTTDQERVDLIGRGLLDVQIACEQGCGA